MAKQQLIAPHLKPLDGPAPADVVAGSDPTPLDAPALKPEFGVLVMLHR